MSATRLKELVLLKLPELMKKLLIEDAVHPFADMVQMLPFVGNLRIGEGQRLALDLVHLIGIMDLALSANEHDFVEVPSLVGNPGGFSRHIRFQPKQVEMPDFLPEVFR